MKTIGVLNCSIYKQLYGHQVGPPAVVELSPPSLLPVVSLREENCSNGQEWHSCPFPDLLPPSQPNPHVIILSQMSWRGFFF